MNFDVVTFCKSYFKCWAKAMSEDATTKYSLSSKAWTAFHMEQILYPFAETLNAREGYHYKTKKCPTNAAGTCPRNCNCNYETSWAKEYYRVDFSLYYYPNNYNWCADFFIEHENAHFELREDGSVKQQGWLGEFMKLLPLKCSDIGARVIISYDSFVNLDNKINYLCRMLNDTNSICRQSLANSPILIILGPTLSTIRKTTATDFRIITCTCQNEKWRVECNTLENVIGNDDIKQIFSNMHAYLKKQK